MTEGEAAKEYGNSSDDAVEKIEGAHSIAAHEIKQRALYGEIGEGLVQALVDAIDTFCWYGLHEAPVLSNWWNYERERLPALYPPEPGEDIGCENSHART